VQIYKAANTLWRRGTGYKFRIAIGKPVGKISGHANELGAKLILMVSISRLRISVAGFMVVLLSCNSPSPEKAFDVAVLNSNMFVGFAGSGMERELQSPSVKMGATKDAVVTMKHTEVVELKLKFAEENYDKLKNFSQTDDSKDIIQNSIALHELIIPVYKNEYMQLAKLYDSNASKSDMEKLGNAIRDKYFLKFEAAYNQLISKGKLFAKEHHIEVRWAM
jgi:hypothetical protein